MDSKVSNEVMELELIHYIGLSVQFGYAYWVFELEPKDLSFKYDAKNNLLQIYAKIALADDCYDGGVCLMESVKQKANLGLTHNIPMPEVFRELCEAFDIDEDDMTFVYVKDRNELQIQVHTKLYF